MTRTCAVLLLIVGLAAAPSTAAPVDPARPGTQPPASPDPKTLAVPDADLSKARQLVQQLGSEQFAERERAEETLAKMGRVARAALLEGANTDPSQEVRTRCQSLLPKATAQ